MAIGASTNTSRPNACQVSTTVKRVEVPCLAKPEYEIAVFMATPAGMQQNAYRVCEHHRQAFVTRYGDQVVAVRPWVPRRNS
jgi:hypothetical protein